MSRLRTIKPGFFLDEVLGDCRPLARLLFAGLWTIADREGRLEDRPRRIKVETLPYDECDVDELLDELVRHDFIVRYEVDGARYIAIPKWAKHQSPHMKEAPSVIPAPDEHQTSMVLSPYEPAGVLGLGSGNLEEPPLPPQAVDKSAAPVENLGEEQAPPQEQPATIDLVSVVGPIGRLCGVKRIDEALTESTQLNAAITRYLAAVDALVDEYLGELSGKQLDEARAKCRYASLERITTKPKNPAAYLTAAAGNATCLGDLVGDDFVTELRAKPKRRRSSEPRHIGEVQP